MKEVADAGVSRNASRLDAHGSARKLQGCYCVSRYRCQRPAGRVQSRRAISPAIAARMIKGMERVALMLKLDIRAVEVHPRGIRQDSSPKLTSIDYGKIVDNADRRYCGIGGRSDVDGGWRICFGQFAVSSPSRLTLRGNARS
jgi:hypothetical protein